MQIANVSMPGDMMKPVVSSKGMPVDSELFTGMLEAVLTQWPEEQTFSEALLKPGRDMPVEEKPEQGGAEVGFATMVHPQAATTRMCEQVPDGQTTDQGAVSSVHAGSRPFVPLDTVEPGLRSVRGLVQNVLSGTGDDRQTPPVAKDQMMQTARLVQTDRNGQVERPEEQNDLVLTTQKTDDLAEMAARKGTPEVQWQRTDAALLSAEGKTEPDSAKNPEKLNTPEPLVETANPVSQTVRQDTDRRSQTAVRTETGMRELLDPDTGRKEPEIAAKQSGPVKEPAGPAQVSEDGKSVESFRMELAGQQSEQVRTVEGQPEQVDRIVENLLERVEHFRTDGRDVLKMRLYPEELGRLEIRMEMRDGILSGRLLLESDEARQWMARELGALSAQLEARGVVFEHLEVVSGQSWQNPAGQFGQGPQEGPAPQQNPARGDLGQQDAEPVQRLMDEKRAGRLDILA